MTSPEPMSPVALRLIERARVYAEEAYRRGLGIEPVLIAERSSEPERKPYEWTMRKAKFYRPNKITQEIDEDVKDSFATSSRLVAIALKSEAIAIVSECWLAVGKRRGQETMEEAVAREKLKAKEGLFYHDERQEVVVCFMNYIEAGEVKKIMHRWDLKQEGRRTMLVDVLQQWEIQTEASGRLVNIITTASPVPDFIAEKAKSLFRMAYGVNL